MFLFLLLIICFSAMLTGLAVFDWSLSLLWDCCVRTPGSPAVSVILGSWDSVCLSAPGSHAASVCFSSVCVVRALCLLQTWEQTRRNVCLLMCRASWVSWVVFGGPSYAGYLGRCWSLTCDSGCFRAPIFYLKKIELSVPFHYPIFNCVFLMLNVLSYLCTLDPSPLLDV